MNRSNIFNAVHLSISFVLIFMSYGVAQMFQTSSDHAKSGAIALCLVYTGFCMSNLTISSYLVQLFGVRLSLIIPSFVYILFVACNIKYNMWVLYVVSFALGISAGVLWTAQGVYITLSTNQHETLNSLKLSSTSGFINGIFFGFMQLSSTLGNLVAAYLFHLQLRLWIIFTTMTAICGCGTISLCLLRPVHMLSKTEQKQRSILSSLSLFMDGRFLFLVPTTCYSGLLQSFLIATLPPLIIDKSRKYFIFAIASAINAGGAIAFGKLSDRLGRRLPVFALSFLMQAIILGLLLTVWQPPIDQRHIGVFIGLAVGLGMGDAIQTTLLYAVLGMFYGQTRPSDAFTNFKLIQSGFLAIGSLQSNYLSFNVQIIVLIASLSLASVTLVVCHYGFSSLDTVPTTTPMPTEQKEMDEVEAKSPLNTSLSIST